VKIGTPIWHRLGIFRYFAAAAVVTGGAVVFYGMIVTGPNTASAAYAAFRINERLGGAGTPGFPKENSPLGAEFGTEPAAHADRLIHLRLAVVVHDRFPRPAAVSHADIFERPAKAAYFMALKDEKG
jgi:hypothetical protein